jgi:hypothetical protein
MSGRRGRPKTSGNSHNKASKTYVSSRVNRDLRSPPPKIQAKNNLESFFRPVNKKTLPEPETPTQKLISHQLTFPLDPVEPSTSQEISVESLASPFPSVSPISSLPSDSELSSDDDQVPNPYLEQLIPKSSLKNSIFDGRTNKLQFTVKWEKAYTWAYYSASKEGWFCKTCEEYSDYGDEFWKTLPRTHDKHPGVFFQDHEKSAKHAKSIKCKKELKAILSKGNVIRQLERGIENKNAADRKRNRKIIKKLIQTVYFMAKKKWAVKENFEEIVTFMAFEMNDEELAFHLEKAPKNASYSTANSVEQFLKCLGDFLNDELIGELQSTGDFTILADESTDEGDRSQLSIFVRFVDVNTNLPVEKFLGIVKLTVSKKAIDLHETIMQLLTEKGIDSGFIRFSGLDGTNAMSGERKGLQRLIRHTSPHSMYINCRNHRLALCLVHLIPKYPKLKELDALLISLWKTFKFSTIKQAVFENAQVEHDLKPMKIIKAVVTRWLTHGESCARVISRFEPLIDALDAIFQDKKDAEAKGVRDLLIEPDILLTLLLLAEVLSPINIFSKFLQTSTLLYCSVTAKLHRLLNRLDEIKGELKNHSNIDTNLKYFNNAVPFLRISAERNDLGRNLRDRVLANEQEPQEIINNYLQKIGYNFLDDLSAEIRNALQDNNPIIPAFNVFLPSEINSLLDRNDQLNILRDHYGQPKIDQLDGDYNRVNSLINSTEQDIESEEFFNEFEDAYMLLIERVKISAKKKFQSGEISQSSIYNHINANKPTSADVYAAMCKSGCLLTYTETMKLFKFSLLIPPSTSGVERGFSVMNLLVSPLRTSLNQLNIDRLMRICINGPNSFTEEQLEVLVENFKNSTNRRIDL